ncbi:hypothetical protein Q7P35_010249 [Cladosporium inversicolor]
MFIVFESHEVALGSHFIDILKDSAMLQTGQRVPHFGSDTITTAGLVEDTVQFSHSTRSPGRNNAGTNVTATAPKAPAQQPPTPTTTVPTPPASRPLTPSTPAGTLSSPPSSPTKPEINPSARSKWLNHLSHISIATWIGVGLALGGLNDFREACKSELEAGLQQSAACNRTLAKPAQPPPIMKRTISVMESKDPSREVAPWVVATCFALLLALCNGLRSSTVQQQGVSATGSLSLAQLVEGVIERSESHPQAMISFLEMYLARESFEPESDSARVLRGYSDALIHLVARQCPSIKISSLATEHMESRDFEAEESEPGEIEPTETLPSQSPPTQNAEPPNAMTQDDTETETDEKHAEGTIVQAPELVAPSPTTVTAGSNTSADIAPSPARADSSTERWKAIPEVITTAITRSIALTSPQPVFLTRVDAKRPRGPLSKELLRGLRSAFGFVYGIGSAILQCSGRMSRDLFETSQGLFYFLALILGGYWASLLVLVSYDGIVVLAQLAITLPCYFTAVALREREVARSLDRTLDLCVNRLLLFSVYTCFGRIWPTDMLVHNALTWATGTGLFVWALAAYCVVHETDNGQRREFSTAFLRRWVLSAMFSAARDRSS